MNEGILSAACATAMKEKAKRAKLKTNLRAAAAVLEIIAKITMLRLNLNKGFFLMLLCCTNKPVPDKGRRHKEQERRIVQGRDENRKLPGESAVFPPLLCQTRYFFRLPVERHQPRQQSVFIKRRFPETIRKFPACPGEWFGNPPDFSGFSRPSYPDGAGQTEFHDF